MIGRLTVSTTCQQKDEDEIRINDVTHRQNESRMFGYCTLTPAPKL